MQGNLLGRVSVRISEPSTTLTRIQSQVDQLVGGAVAQATDGKMLASMVVGATAFRLGRLGIAALGEGTSLRALSLGGGLTAEVSAFELTHRGLSSAFAGGHGPFYANLWSWNGSGGIRQGLLHSFVTFGALKGAGRLTQGENLIAQHLFQDTALVLGHQVSGALGITPRPTESLAEQFLHAEATNLEIGAGLFLAHGMSPGLHALEKGLDVSLRSPGLSIPKPLRGQEAFVFASGAQIDLSSPERQKDKPFILMAEKLDDEVDSEPPPSSGARNSSEPPVGGGIIEQNAHSWAIRNFRPAEDEGLVTDLAWKIREEMWQVMNLRIDSPEARALAHGDLMSVQIHPIDGSLENYRVVLTTNLEAPSDDVEYVQWTLDPMTGAIGSVSDSPRPPPSTPRPGFLSFYRWIDFVSDGLKSDSLFEGLSPQIQEFLLADRATQVYQAAREAPTLHQVPGPTDLVAYFDHIAEGVRESVEVYCNLHHLSERGKRRLERLTQIVLAAIYQKELEFPKYSQYPQFHIWVIPHPEDSSKKRVEILTASEAFQWHQDRGGKVGERDILLVLDRTYWGPGKTQPILMHQYTHVDSKREPIGADLEFQNYLGLGNNRLKLYMLDLVPTPEKIAEWAAKQKKP